jgi:hypothetical protein
MRVFSVFNRTHPAARLSGVLLGLFSSLHATERSAAAGADQASLTLGFLSYGSSETNSLLGSSGYAITFLSENRKAKVRLALGSQLEMCSGVYAEDQSAATLLRGAFLVGANFFPMKTEFVSPYVSTLADMGWGYLSRGGTESMGLNAGLTVSGGADLRISRDPAALALRVGSSYRLSRGFFVGEGTIQLDALTFFFGVTF